MKFVDFVRIRFDFSEKENKYDQCWLSIAKNQPFSLLWWSKDVR